MKSRGALHDPGRGEYLRGIHAHWSFNITSPSAFPTQASCILLGNLKRKHSSVNDHNINT